MSMSYGLALIMTASAQETTTRTLPAAMPRLVIQGGKSDITIRYDPEMANSELLVTPTNWWEGCELSFSGDRREAVMAFLEEDEASRGCATEIELVLAGRTDIEIWVEHGTVHVEDMPGELLVNMKSGRVTGTPAGESAIALKRGRVTLWDLSAPVDAVVKLGRIDLTYTESFIGTVSANVTVGQITTRFPYGTWLDAAVSTGIGRQLYAIPSRSTATTHLDAASRVGSIRVKAIVESEEDVVLSAAE
jgi:hypothetical protein